VRTARDNRSDVRPPAFARRFGRAAALAVAGAWLFWIVVAQLFLATPLLRAILNSQSPAIHVEYRLAWSLWPGTVHLRGMVLTAQDRAVQWRLGLDEATATIALLDLPRRIFHVRRVRAQGVQFALRRRIYWTEAWGERVDGLPQIEGLPLLPLAAEGPNDKTPDTRYRLFTVWLENVQGDEVRQIWIDRWRVEGAAEVAGSFYLKPVRELLIEPAELRLHGAAVRMSRSEVAGRVDGVLRVRLGPVDVRELKAPALFRALTTDAELAGAIAGLEFLPGFEGGAGQGSLALHVQAGQVLPGSELSLQLGPASARAGKLVASAGALGLRFKVPEGLPPQRARTVLELSDLRFGPPRQAPAARLAQARIEAVGEPPDFADPRPPAWVVADLRRGLIDDAAALSATLLPDDAVRVERGHGAFAAHLEGPMDQLAGWARASLAEMTVRAHGEVIHGAAILDARVAALDPWRGADLSGTLLRIDGANVLHDNGTADAAPDWWGRFGFPRAELRFAPAAGAPMLDADLEARCRDARPIVGLYVNRADLPGVMKGLFSMNGLSVRGSAAAGQGWVALREVIARGEGASVRATMRAQNGHPLGAAVLTVRGLSIAVGLDGSKTSLQLITPGDYYESRKAQLRHPPPVLARLPRAKRPTRRSRAAPVQAAR